MKREIRVALRCGCGPNFHVRRRRDALELDALLNVRNSQLLKLAQCHTTITSFFPVPIHVRMLMRDWQQHIQSAVSGGAMVASVRTGFST